MTAKYFTLKRFNSELFDNIKRDLLPKQLAKINNRLDISKPLLLIEIYENSKGNESYSNLYTVGYDINLISDIIKGRIMYDYSGLSYPIIHLKNNTYTFKHYCELLGSNQIN